MSTVIEELSDNKRKAEGYSFAEKHSIFYKWEINDIISFIKAAKSTKKIRTIESPKFSTGSRFNDLWCLRFKINEEKTEDKSWVSLDLTSMNNSEIRTKFDIFILDNEKRKISSNLNIITNLDDFKSDFIFKDLNAKYGYGEFAETDELLKKKCEFLQNDTLIVCVDLVVYDDYVGVNNPFNSLTKSSKRNLSDDFKDLFADKKKCDIKIQIGKKLFDAHKLILTTRSSVFEAMFSHDMKENKKNKTNIPDVVPEVFEKVLQFIYTDKVDDLDDFAEELLEASDKYQLEALKEMCEDSIAQTLSVENSIRVLVLADRHSAKQLVKCALKYIVINLASLKNTEEYKALEESHPSLFLAVLKKLVDEL